MHYQYCVLPYKNCFMLPWIGEEKIPHTGSTRPSRTCVIRDYQLYTMSLSQYNGCCQYDESISIP